MDKLTYELLIEVNGRMEADLLKSYLEAEGIPVEIFQEAAGHNVYPVMVDGLGFTQLFVPKERAAEARELLEQFQNAKDSEE
ncbi:MAG: DUF2007 domain-containing protein [Chloroflexi bacterium]|nr:DUF2007 domain-containing protein [Chloroflexota bacterium]